MTSIEILDRLIRLFSDFQEAWDADDNYFRPDDGAFTCCGVFARFSQFFKEDCHDWGPVALDDISTLLEDCLMFPDSESGTAAATCFLENIEGEQAEDCLSGYLGPLSRKFLAAWRSYNLTHQAAQVVGGQAASRRLNRHENPLPCVRLTLPVSGCLASSILCSCGLIG
jgi:hypothetical protein